MKSIRKTAKFGQMEGGDWGQWGVEINGHKKHMPFVDETDLIPEKPP